MPIINLTIDDVIEHCERHVENADRFATKGGRVAGKEYMCKQYAGHYYTAGWLKELKEYKQLEEQGLLLKLPCKIGSLVYEIKKDLNSMKRETIEHNGHYYSRNIDVYFITQVTFEIEDISSLGKTVFLTKEEAEKALEEMEKKEK